MTKDIIEFAKFLAVLVAIFGGTVAILYWTCRLAAKLERKAKGRK